MEIVMKYKLVLARVFAGSLLLAPGQPGLAQGSPGLDTAAIERASGLKGQLIADENVFKIGTAEIKNWYPVIAAMNADGKKFHQVDYVPCYRSEAGTGNAMCFAYWE